MYRGNLHRAGDDVARHWQVPPPTLSASRFRRLLRSRSLAVSRLAGATRPNSPSSSPNSRLDEGAAGPVREAEEVDGDQQQQQHEEQQVQGHDVQQHEGEAHDVEQLEVEEEGLVEQQHGGDVVEEEEHEEGAVEDVEMDDAGEVVVGGGDASGNGDPEEGQGESEGVDHNPEVRLVAPCCSLRNCS